MDSEMHRSPVTALEVISFCASREVYVGRSSCKVSYFFSRGMKADRNVKVVGGDVAVL